MLKVLSSTWVKAAIALIVVGLLVYFNRVDAAALAGVSRSWPWLLAAFLLMLPPFAILSFRFKIVLASQGFEVSLLQAIRWTMIGAFFDLAMPSSCGGDLVKAGLLAKQVDIGQRAKAVVTVAFDRFLGMLGLFLLAAFACAAGWWVLQDLPARNLLAGLTVGTSLGAMMFLRVVGARQIYRSRFVERTLSRNSFGVRIREFVGFFNALRERPKYLFTALGMSVLNHMFWCASLFCIARVLGYSVEPLKGLVVFPLAIFSNIFGVAGGFGVGTAGFDLLLSQLLAIGNGALVGLMFQTLSAIARLTGLPFYLFSPPGVTREGAHEL